MFDVFGSLRSVLKTDAICIDNNIFRLHYKVSVIVLMACSLIVTSRQYIGEPICCTLIEDVPQDVINLYCWIHGTFTMPGALTKKVGQEVPHPGIDTYTDTDERTFHSYYQWVCFVLFFQAALFYIPRYIWKSIEGGKIQMLISDLGHPIVPGRALQGQKARLTTYVVNNLGGHTVYICAFITCEVFNFINVVGQIYLMDKFLGGAFSSYGLEVLSFTEVDQEERSDPMIRVFPRITKCTFHKYGPSGDIQKHDALCVLPLNIVNEKIYVLLWFWFIILSIITGLSLIYRAMVVFMPKFRVNLLKMRIRVLQRGSRMLQPGSRMLQPGSRMLQQDYVDIVVQKAQLGDWFVLDLLGKNMDSFTFGQFIKDLAGKFERMEIICPRNL